MRGVTVIGLLVVLGRGMALRTEGPRSVRGSSREPKLLFSTFFQNSRIQELTATVSSLVASLTTLQARVATLEASSSATGGSGGLLSQSEVVYEMTHTALFSNITDLYSKVRANRADVDKKCPRTKCDKILKKVKKVKASVEFIQTANITVLEALVDMLKNSSTGEQLVDLAPIKACMTDPTATGCLSTYGGPTSLPTLLAGKCDSGTCDTLQASVADLTTCMTTPAQTGCTSKAIGGTGSLPAALATNTADLTPVKACMTDPTAASCTTTYSGSTALPGVVAGKCAGSTCASLQTSVDTIKTDLTVVKDCFTDPSAAGCTTTYSAAATLPASLAALNTCMQTPTAAACTGSPAGAAGSLPATVAAKCDQSTCSLLTTCLTTPEDAACTIATTATSLPAHVTALNTCMQTPTAAGCTGITNGAAGSLPATVAAKCDQSTCSLLTTCMTTPAAATCTIATTATSLPKKVTDLDKCMTDIEDATCTASYGATTNFVSSVSGRGAGLVGWVQQLRQPSTVTCYMTTTTNTILTDSASVNTIGPAGAPTGTGAGTPVAITPNCDVSKLYEQIVWNTCIQSDQPDNASKKGFHMDLPAASKNKIEIKQDGYYRIEFNALISSTDGKITRGDVFKVSTKDPDTNNGDCTVATASACTGLIQLRVQTKHLDSPPAPASSKTNQRSSNGEGVFRLCAGDEIITIASKSGSTTNNAGTILGDSRGARTKLTVQKIWYANQTP